MLSYSIVLTVFSMMKILVTNNNKFTKFNYAIKNKFILVSSTDQDSQVIIVSQVSLERYSKNV